MFEGTLGAMRGMRYIRRRRPQATVHNHQVLHSAGAIFRGTKPILGSGNDRFRRFHT